MQRKTKSPKTRSFSAAQTELLSAIKDRGSISAAARALGISYKTAWDRIDGMNNMSSKALVARSSGGARGGGTHLTPYGEQLLQGLQTLQSGQEALAANLGRSKESADLKEFIRAQVNSSARNQYFGRVKRISKGAINSEVVLAISGKVEIIAVITNESLRNLQLKKGSNAVALVKASWILLSTSRRIATSARNQLRGKVSKISRGQVNCEVILDLGEEKSICAVITRESVKTLGLKKGSTATALFKASSVILMTT